jgi:hypothetical protein
VRRRIRLIGLTLAVIFLAGFLSRHGAGVLAIALVVAGVGFILHRARRDRASLVAWLVAMAASTVIAVPSSVMSHAHYKHLAVHVFADLFLWLALAAFVRLAIFLADYLRGRAPDGGLRSAAQ